MGIIYDTKSKEWDNCLTNLSSNYRDIYFTRKYYEMYEKNGDGKGLCFVYKEQDKIAIYPFLINPIVGYDLDEEYYDIETAYGYGGPLISHYEEQFIKRFEHAFLDFCKEKNIIAEFIRFHPLINNHNIFSSNIKIQDNRTTVYLDLSKGIETVWKDEITSKNRNMIRKAEKNGVKIASSYDYKLFRDIYEHTMDKVGANGYYYFRDEYYYWMEEDKNYNLLSAMKDNRIIASAIFIQYEDYCHYHLAGSLREYLKFAPNNLLLWEAIKFGYEKGAKFFHLGGGITNKSDDPLLKYKGSFSTKRASFYIGKRVHNQEVYDYLIYIWQKKYNQQPKLFLQYKF